jgi:hypothetical protein
VWRGWQRQASNYASLLMAARAIARSIATSESGGQRLLRQSGQQPRYPRLPRVRSPTVQLECEMPRGRAEVQHGMPDFVSQGTVGSGRPLGQRYYCGLQIRADAHL